jgi:hypothetical protein
MKAGITQQQAAILEQIMDLYEQLKATSSKHYTLQQWYGLKDTEDDKPIDNRVVMPIRVSNH